MAKKEIPTTKTKTTTTHQRKPRKTIKKMFLKYII